jgi:hypothetical protein
MAARLRWFELALVLGIAFGGPLVSAMAIAFSDPATRVDATPNASAIYFLVVERFRR